jgi:hypothetical protein
VFGLDRSCPPERVIPRSAPRRKRATSKWISTEWITFVGIFGVSTACLFTGRASFANWLIAALGSAVVCGTVRTVKHLRIMGMEFEREERQ